MNKNYGTYDEDELRPLEDTERKKKNFNLKGDIHLPLKKRKQWQVFYKFVKLSLTNLFFILAGDTKLLIELYESQKLKFSKKLVKN